MISKGKAIYTFLYADLCSFRLSSVHLNVLILLLLLLYWEGFTGWFLFEFKYRRLKVRGPVADSKQGAKYDYWIGLMELLFFFLNNQLSGATQNLEFKIKSWKYIDGTFNCKDCKLSNTKTNSFHFTYPVVGGFYSLSKLKYQIFKAHERRWSV